MASFDLILRTRASLHPNGEPTDFISSHSGVLACIDDESGEATQVGRVSALKIHAHLALDAGVTLFDVCDAHSQELNRLHSLLYDHEGGLKGELVHRFEALDSDVLVLDYVILDPKWRRLNLGLLAVRKLVDLLGGGCGLAVSLIAPLRPKAHKLLRVPADWLPRATTKEQRRESRIKLRQYFRRMGFRRLDRTPYYALSLHQITPDGKQLLGREPDLE